MAIKKKGVFIGTMNAAVLKGIREWNFMSMPIPKCGDNDVIIETKVSGICSTDVIRSMKTGFYHYPIIPGHEFCGIVVECGKNVNNRNVGDKVAVYPLIPCKRCKACVNGQYNLCSNYNFIGSRTHGGYAQYVLCPAENTVKIPESVTFEQASMTEPLSVALHAFKVAGMPSRKDKIVIMGLGPIGLLVSQWAMVFGVQDIIGFARNEYRISLSKDNGIRHAFDTRLVDPDKVVMDITGGEGVNYVFECSGSNLLQPQAVRVAARTGKVVILGNPEHSLKLDKDVYSLLLRRELKLFGSWSSMIFNENEWEESLKNVEIKKVDPSRIITHKFFISDVASIMERMYLKKFEFMKVVFNL